MWKKFLILAGVGVAVALVARKIKANNDERALWHEATATPDVR